MADEPESDRTTTVVHTERRGSGGWIAVLVLLLLGLLMLYMFREEIFSAASETEKVEVEVTTGNGS